MGGWFGLVAPAGTPPEAIKALHAAAHKAMATPEFTERAAAIAGVSMANSPEQIAAQIQQTLARYRGIVEKAKIELK